MVRYDSSTYGEKISAQVSGIRSNAFEIVVKVMGRFEVRGRGSVVVTYLDVWVCSESSS